ncbi:MAG: TM1812 family CRISPR-associated protein [Bilifractor sp.]
MKKFITYIAKNIGHNLQALQYQAVDNNKLSMDHAYHFPIVAALHGYAKKGDEVQVVEIYVPNDVSYEANHRILEQEIDAVSREIGFTWKPVHIEVSDAEVEIEHLKTYSKLINIFQDNDEVYMCTTYGTKPIPIIEMMALNFAYRVRKNLSVPCIVYGSVDRNDPAHSKGFIYDISPLFYMMQLSNTLADQRVKDPEKKIAQIMNFDEDWKQE